MSGDFCTNNAQAPSLFFNVTSRRTKLMVCETVSGNSALLRALLPETVSQTINFVRLLVTLEKREGACALFVQKSPDIHSF